MVIALCIKWFQSNETVDDHRQIGFHYVNQSWLPSNKPRDTEEEITGKRILYRYRIEVIIVSKYYLFLNNCDHANLFSHCYKFCFRFKIVFSSGNTYLNQFQNDPQSSASCCRHTLRNKCNKMCCVRIAEYPRLVYDILYMMLATRHIYYYNI
jgi:hypothetical protein